MFSVIALVAWAIIGLPLVQQASTEHLWEDAPHWFVAAFTGLLVYVTYRLVTSTNKLWTATTNAANAQQTDTRIIQRAYLSVEPGGLQPLVDGSPRLVCTVIIRNAGNLPARDVSWYIDREIVSEDDHDIFPTPWSPSYCRQKATYSSIALRTSTSLTNV
jgi:hypothetical protein